ncbi:MAG: hypothetical protein ACPGPS_18135 [Rubripirellula sp.]
MTIFKKTDISHTDTQFHSGKRGLESLNTRAQNINKKAKSRPIFSQSFEITPLIIASLSDCGALILRSPKQLLSAKPSITFARDDVAIAKLESRGLAR